jgi:hypothetical protein
MQRFDTFEEAEASLGEGESVVIGLTSHFTTGVTELMADNDGDLLMAIESAEPTSPFQRIVLPISPSDARAIARSIFQLLGEEDAETN